MASDAGDLDRPEPPQELELPTIRNIVIRRVQFRPPERRNFESRLPAVDDAVEFAVETAGPIPVRALGPVLFVGDVAVTEVTPEDDRTYRFVALQPDALQDGATISLGWSGSTTANRIDSGFVYHG